jgi:hypothetical protein
MYCVPPWPYADSPSLSLMLDLHVVQLLIGKTMMGTRTLKHQQLVHPLGA